MGIRTVLDTANLVAFAATANPAKAQAFYSGTLNLHMREESPFALVFDANGTTLRLQKVETVSALPYTVLGWEVADIALTVQDLTDKGVVFDRHAGLEQDALGVWSTPDGARVAWFKDPDGNTLSVTQLSA